MCAFHNVISVAANHENDTCFENELVMGAAVSCGYSTCFAISACDGLCHLTKVHPSGSVSGSPQSLDYTQKSTKSTLALKLNVSRPFYPWVTATMGSADCMYYAGVVVTLITLKIGKTILALKLSVTSTISLIWPVGPISLESDSSENDFFFQSKTCTHGFSKPKKRLNKDVTFSFVPKGFLCT